MTLQKFRHDLPDVNILDRLRGIFWCMIVAFQHSDVCQHRHNIGTETIEDLHDFQSRQLWDAVSHGYHLDNVPDLTAPRYLNEHASLLL